MNTCYYCGPTQLELRPYGPGGSGVCYPCISGDDERDAAAETVFAMMLDVASIISPIVLLGGPDGPKPLDPNMTIADLLTELKGGTDAPTDTGT